MKIIVHPLLPTGNFLNCRIGVERDYPDDYSLEQAINTEWDNLIAIHMKRYPHLYNEKGEPIYEKVMQHDEFKGTVVTDVVDTVKQDEVIAKLYVKVEKKLKSFKFRQDAQKYLDGTEFKLFAPARTIVNSLPLKNI